MEFVAAHMLGDFVIQTDTIAARKFDDWRVRTLHVLTYLLPFLALTPFLCDSWQQAAAMLIAIAVPHWVVDCRRWVKNHPWPAKAILVDQSIHAVCLAPVAIVFG
jgi:hypothetical protein